MAPDQLWAPTWSVKVAAAYSTTVSGVVVDAAMLDQKELEVARLLGLPLGSVQLNATSSPLPAATSRRKLYFYENQPMVTDSCENGTQVVIAITLLTASEAQEKAFIQALHDSSALALTNANNDTITSCSNPVISSLRSIAVAPAPPNPPPPPFISALQIQSSGTTLVGASLFAFLCVGLCGQRAFAPSLRRREKEKKLQDGAAGESLLGAGTGTWAAGKVETGEA